MRRRLPVLILPLMLGMLLAGAPAAQAQPPFPPVPQLKYEPVPPAPGPEQDYLWQPGHWDWTGAKYAWVQGTWIERHLGYHEYRQGVWVRHSGDWEWSSAHWQ